MIDNFGLVLTHGLLLLVAWRLLFRADLDDDDVMQPPRWRAAGTKDEPGA